MSSYDRWLEQPYADEAAREDEYSDAWHEQYDYIEDCFKKGEPIKYSGRQIHPDNTDLYNYVAEHQQELLRLMANKDDAGLLKKMKEIYQQNMECLIDLTIG